MAVQAPAALALYGPGHGRAILGRTAGEACGVMLLGRRKLKLETARLRLRPPVHSDFNEWAALRRASEEYLTPWEPIWAQDHLSRKSFTNRVYWAQRSVASGTAIPLFLFRRSDDVLVGAITLDNIRRGPAQAGTLGLWTGQSFARNGYMREAIGAGRSPRLHPPGPEPD